MYQFKINIPENVLYISKPLENLLEWTVESPVLITWKSYWKKQRSEIFALSNNPGAMGHFMEHQMSL